MFNLHTPRSSMEKIQELKYFKPNQQTWIVSDLQSKWHLQSLLLERQPVLEEEAVTRASEFWRKLAVQLLPTTRILSPELAQSLFWHWVEPMELPWLRTPQSLRLLMTQMKSWIGVFADPDYPERMQAWFHDNPEYYVRWGQWFELSQVLWKKCLEANVVLPKWLPSLLLQQNLSQLQIHRHLIFDLGVQMSPVEGQLIAELAKHFSIEVFKPQTKWTEDFLQPMHSYHVLEGTGAKVRSEKLEWDHLGKSHIFYPRYSTRLAEVKAAVSQVRQWLEVGVPMHQIAVIAPDIEEHWSALSLYLQEEGIPVRKARVARLHTFPEMVKWLANVRLATQNISATDLETSLFFGEENVELTFEEFRVLYSKLYGPEDLQRSSQVAERIRAQHLSEEPINQEQFFMWSLKYWPRQARHECLEKFAQFVTQDSPLSLELPPKEWLSYWQGVMSRMELALQEGADDGIWCVSLSSADWLTLSHGFFLNLSAGAMRQLSSSPVRFSELEKLSRDLGYPVDSPDQQQLEFEFLWLLENPWKEFVAAFAQTDFSGATLTPSRLWLWGSHLQGKKRKSHDFNLPTPTRWDEIQKSSVKEISEARQWPLARAKNLMLGLGRDIGVTIEDWPSPTELKLSASGLEAFLKCPFIFNATRLLHLKDDPVLDLDLDAMSRGRLMHALFAKLMIEPVRYDWTESEIEELIEQARAEEDVRIGEPGLWPATVRTHVQLGKALLKMEKDWRERFPKARTQAIEQDFSCYWDVETAQPTSQETSVSLRGRLDRVDCDEQSYAVLDYKSSTAGLVHWQSWLRNNALQLSLYAQLVEKGLTLLQPMPAVAANYYVVRDRDRSKGYFQQDATTELFDISEKRRNGLTEDQKEQHWHELNQKIQGVVKQIQQGQLNPLPEKLEICKSCQWSSLCRAKHLN